MFENYYSTIDNVKHPKTLAKFIISAHNLRVESARFNRMGIVRNLGVCNFCDLGELEDEELFLLRDPSVCVCFRS